MITPPGVFSISELERQIVIRFYWTVNFIPSKHPTVNQKIYTFHKTQDSLDQQCSMKH